MKQMRLPHGYGSIRYLGPGRRRPYAVCPPGASSGKGAALCYVSDWFIGFAVLTAWHAGVYYPGLEKERFTVPAGYEEHIEEAWPSGENTVLLPPHLQPVV